MSLGYNTGEHTIMTRVWNAAGGSTPTSSTRWDSSWPAFVPEPQRTEVLSYFDTRFGIPLSTYMDFRLLERSKVYVLLRDSPHLGGLGFLKVQNVGLPVLRKIRRHLKPTTAALQCFGAHATRHRTELSTSQMAQLLSERKLQLHIDWDPGYVILFHAGEIVGCGMYTPGWLHSQIPQRLSTQQRVDLL
jgi:hypothetical protein